MSSKRAGDTLIEVLFAFAILSLVISVMFSGAMSSFKAAENAQDRTTATFLAQYQADALKTYRDSLAWDQPTTSGPSFIKGGGTDRRTLPKAADYINSTSKSCMQLNPADTDAPYAYWTLQGDEAICTRNAKELAPSLINPSISIKGSLGNNDTNIQAIITVSWTTKNSNQTESVVNTILLTQQR